MADHLSRYYARVEKVYPPKYNADPKARDAHMDASSSSTLDDDPPHVIGGDLNTPVKDALAKDNPDLYYYWVYLTELERDKSHEKGKGTTKITDQDKRLVGSLIEVQCNMMRLVFLISPKRLQQSDLFLSKAVIVSPFQNPFFVALFAIAWIAMLLWHLLGLSSPQLLNDMA